MYRKTTTTLIVEDTDTKPHHHCSLVPLSFLGRSLFVHSFFLVFVADEEIILESALDFTLWHTFRQPLFQPQAEQLDVAGA